MYPEIITTGRGGGKTHQLAEWVKQGREIPQYPGWTRVIVTHSQPAATWLRINHQLNFYQVFAWQDWIFATGVPQSVEVGVDNAHLILRECLRMRGTIVKAAFTVDPVRPPLTVSTGALMILDERVRQVQGEGFTPEHDDEYVNGELVKAGVAYAYAATECLVDCPAYDGSVPMWWPWNPMFWKPGSAIRMLVKAGAMIAAEIDRLLRLDGVDKTLDRLGVVVDEINELTRDMDAQRASAVAAVVTDAMQEMIRERGDLVQKKYESGLSVEEAARLDELTEETDKVDV